MKLSEILKEDQTPPYIRRVGKALQKNKKNRSSEKMIKHLRTNLLGYLAHLKHLPYTY